MIFLLLLCSIVSQAEQFGLLLTSPSQREKLNALREKYQQNLYLKSDEDKEITAHKFNGFVGKNNNVKTIWVNGDALSASELVPHSKVEHPIALPIGSVMMKPGQIYRSVSAGIEDYSHAKIINKGE